MCLLLVADSKQVDRLRFALERLSINDQQADSRPVFPRSMLITTFFYKLSIRNVLKWEWNARPYLIVSQSDDRYAKWLTIMYKQHLIGLGGLQADYRPDLLMLMYRLSVLNLSNEEEENYIWQRSQFTSSGFLLSEEHSSILLHAQPFCTTLRSSHADSSLNNWSSFFAGATSQRYTLHNTYDRYKDKHDNNSLIQYQTAELPLVPATRTTDKALLRRWW